MQGLAHAVWVNVNYFSCFLYTSPWAFLLQQEDKRGWRSCFHQHGWTQKGISVHRTGLEQRCSNEVPPAWLGTAPRHPRGALWQGSASPALLDTPQHDFIFWPKNRCSCFTVCFVPVTNMPDNASLQFYQKHLFGVILNVISYCQPHLQPKKIMTPAGSISFPMERTQVRREGASEQPKLGVPADPQRRSPLISRCAGTAL